MAKTVVDGAVFRTKSAGVAADLKMERQGDAQRGRFEAFGCAGDDVFRGAGFDERDVERVLCGPPLEDGEVVGPGAACKTAANFGGKRYPHFVRTHYVRPRFVRILSMSTCNLVSHVAQGVLEPRFAASGIVVGGRAARVKLGAEVDDGGPDRPVRPVNVRDRHYFRATDDVGVLWSIVVGSGEAFENCIGDTSGACGGGVGLMDDIIVCFNAIEQIAKTKSDRHLLKGMRYLMNLIYCIIFYYIRLGT